MKKCNWLLLLIPLWFIGSVYWYTCITKGLCKNGFSNGFGSMTSSGMPNAKIHDLSNITETWNKVKVEPLTVYFSADSDHVLTEGVDEKLKNIVEYMKQNANAKIAIAGHTNYHKDVAYTEKLGLLRAEKLKSLLVGYGAPADRISTVSKGQRETIVPYSDPDAHNLNRRAVLSIIE